MVIDGVDETFMLDLALRRPWVDSPRVEGSEFLKNPFGGEGGEDLFTLSPGGRRPYGALFLLTEVAANISLGLLGHEDEVVVGGDCVLCF